MEQEYTHKIFAVFALKENANLSMDEQKNMISDILTNMKAECISIGYNQALSNVQTSIQGLIKN